MFGRSPNLLLVLQASFTVFQLICFLHCSPVSTTAANTKEQAHGRHAHSFGKVQQMNLDQFYWEGGGGKTVAPVTHPALQLSTSRPQRTFLLPQWHPLHSPTCSSIHWRGKSRLLEKTGVSTRGPFYLELKVHSGWAAISHKCFLAESVSPICMAEKDRVAT